MELETILVCMEVETIPICMELETIPACAGMETILFFVEMIPAGFISAVYTPLLSFIKSDSGF